MSEELDENPFFQQLFDRVDGLLAVLVTDNDGRTRLRSVKDSNEEFDNNIPSSFISANEQANKLPFGKCRRITSFYKNYIVVQLSSTSIGSSLDRGEEREVLYTTLIARRTQNTQLLLTMVPEIKNVITKMLSN